MEQPGRAIVEANLADLVGTRQGSPTPTPTLAEQHSPEQLADAYALHGQAVIREAMRREVSADRLRILAESPHDAAAAGRVLAETDQPEQAAIVLEHSRAILLDEPRGRAGR